jgi:glycosyltransferase involved in cell wall biosynthesis
MLSLVVSAYNEEKNLPRCLSSVKDLADEIIVLDNGSSDKTSEIAKNAGAKVYEQPNHQMLNINKNYGFSKATGDWILNLDADEEVSEELKNEIINTLSKSQPANPPTLQHVNGYFLPRKNLIFGKWIKHSLWWPDYQLRLFKKGEGKFPEKHVHELLEVSGDTQKLKNSIIHQNYDNINQFLHKMGEIYTENEAGVLQDAKKAIIWKDFLGAPVSDFLKNYFLLEGYKDGQHGLVLNLLQSYVPLISLSKYWEKNGFPEIEIKFIELQKEIKKLQKEISYWLITTEIDQTKNPIKIILLKINRKLL